MTMNLKLDGNKAAGYVALYNSPTREMKRSDGQPFVETIAPGAFSKTLKDGHNIFALSAHNPEDVLGSTQAGTLVLREDATGLYLELDLPPTQAGADLKTLLSRGEPFGGSFGANIDSWIWGSNGGQLTCSLTQLELSEITLTAFPAYPETSIVLRSTKKPEMPIQEHKEITAIAETKEEIVGVSDEYLYRVKLLNL